MTEDSASNFVTDFSKMNSGMVTAFCQTCNKVTDQNYLGLEFYSRKVASRCVECRNTNFQEEDPERFRSRRKEYRQKMKELEEEKKRTLASTEGSKVLDSSGSVSSQELDKATEY